MKRFFTLCVCFVMMLALVGGCGQQTGRKQSGGGIDSESAEEPAGASTEGKAAPSAGRDARKAGQAAATEQPDTSQALEIDTVGSTPQDDPAEVTDGSPSHQTEVQAPEGDLVEIQERLFIAQSNDIYLNPDEYMHKTIKYQGMYKSTDIGDPEFDYHYVIRYGPGCCGYDGEAGFEVAWEGEWPEMDAWCEVMGTLEIYEEGGSRYLRLVLSSLKVKEAERGAEFVST